MDDDANLMDVNLMDLDLNNEPIDPHTDLDLGVRSLLNDDLEMSRGRLSERFRQLEAVNARVMQRHQWRQARNSTEASGFRSGTVGDGDVNGVSVDGNTTTIGILPSVVRGKGYKRDSSHLVAKALEMDTDAKKPEKEGGNFYDCNICLDIATDPVLTVCGHLFCWACFYQVSFIDSTNKECPVCKGEVSDNTIIPIYGNGGSEDRVYDLESGLKIPPRPKARRVESIRQQRVARGLSHVPVAEALRRIRISISSMDEQAANLEDSREGQTVGEASGPSIRFDHSTVLSESVASRSSLLLALGNAERLVLDLGSAILRNDTGPVVVDTGNPSAVQSNQQNPDLMADIYATLPITSSQASDTTSRGNGVSGSLLRVRSLRSSSSSSMPGAPPPSLSQRRRSNMLRILDLDNRDAREARRRRLN